MELQSVHISEEGRNQLITLKTRTGIENWNVLCRWGLCVSLREDTEPHVDITGHTGEAGVEMAWRTFAGDYPEIYMALIKQRCKEQGREVTKKNLSDLLHRHIHRGVSYLVGDPNLQGIVGLLRKTLKKEASSITDLARGLH